MVLSSLLAALALPVSGQPATDKARVLVVAGGCFWCMEAVFQRLDGVLNVESGYAGGTVANPTYEQVCTGTTGHAEAVRITYDPQKTSAKVLLDWFFQAHDPTSLNRQGADEGTQYRSAVFYTDPSSLEEAKAAISRAQVQWTKPLVTALEPLGTFWPAEAYHRNYFNLHRTAGYNRAVIQPKLIHLGLEDSQGRDLKP